MRPKYKLIQQFFATLQYIEVTFDISAITLHKGLSSDEKHSEVHVFVFVQL